MSDNWMLLDLLHTTDMWPQKALPSFRSYGRNSDFHYWLLISKNDVLTKAFCEAGISFIKKHPFFLRMELKEKKDTYTLYLYTKKIVFNDKTTKWEKAIPEKEDMVGFPRRSSRLCPISEAVGYLRILGNCQPHLITDYRMLYSIPCRERPFKPKPRFYYLDLD